jgi:Flp pilus assembly protein TadB
MSRKKNIDLDKVQEEIKKFSEEMHEKNQKRIKNGLLCIAIVPFIFLLLMFIMDTAKVVYLLFWVISLFVMCTYLLVVAYIDDRLQSKMKELGVEMENADTPLIGDDIR